MLMGMAMTMGGRRRRNNTDRGTKLLFHDFQYTIFIKMISITQLKHVSRWIQQWIFKIPVAVIGGYHGGNLGDIALGKSVLNQLQKKNIRSGLQTIYNLSKWPETPKAIVGGGAVGYSGSLNKVATRYLNNYKSVALLGVDFNEKNYTGLSLDLLKGAAYVSCRSETQANKIKEITGRSDIKFHPDIAFSLLNDFCKDIRLQKNAPETKTAKKMLVNVVPLYATIREGEIVPVENYREERPELYEHFDQMHVSYKTVIRDLVSQALSQGYTVESIPFTPQDEKYARIILDGLPVKHIAYNSDPIKMLKKIASADWIIATRFHATIFALKTGAKLSPIAYAIKNELMLQELGISRNQYLTTSDFANGVTQSLKPIMIESDKIDMWETNSETAIQECIHKLYEKAL